MAWVPVRLLLISGLFFLSGFSPFRAQGTEKEIHIPYVAVDRGLSSGIAERKFVVIRTRQDWQDLWRAHRSGAVPERPAPAFDPQDEMVVAVFAGEKRTGGYGIEITRIEEDRAAATLNIFVRETPPLSKAMLIQALTQPYHIVRLRKIDVPVVFTSEAP